MLWVWVKGILMGLAIAAPVGPIALLCIRRTLSEGRWVGLVTGLGAASADGLYGAIAAFGLSAISELLLQNTRYLQVFGGLFLIYLGIITLIKPAEITEGLGTAQTASLVSAYLSTLALTLTNPATIFSFMGAAHIT